MPVVFKQEGSGKVVKPSTPYYNEAFAKYSKLSLDEASSEMLAKDLSMECFELAIEEGMAKISIKKRTCSDLERPGALECSKRSAGMFKKASVLFKKVRHTIKINIRTQSDDHLIRLGKRSSRSCS